MEALRHLLAVYADIKRQHIEEGIKIGIEQAREQRYRKVLLRNIEAVCEVLQIELTEQRCEQLASANAEQLEQVFAQLRTTRRWPE